MIKENGGKAVAVKGDVSQLDDVKFLFDEAAAAFPDEKIEVRENCLPFFPLVCASCGRGDFCKRAGNGG